MQWDRGQGRSNKESSRRCPQRYTHCPIPNESSTNQMFKQELKSQANQARKKSLAGFKTQKPNTTNNGANGKKRQKRINEKSSNSSSLQQKKQKTNQKNPENLPQHCNRKVGRTGGRNNNQGRGNGGRRGQHCVGRNKRRQS